MKLNIYNFYQAIQADNGIYLRCPEDALISALEGQENGGYIYLSEVPFAN